jgi:hypothetical protein
MRKSLLAMAALMGVATLPAHAWRVNIDQETYADIGFATIVRGISEGKRSESPDEKSRLNFYVPLFNITAGGHVNKLVYFSMNLEGPHNTTVRDSGGDNVPINEFYPRVRDAFIGLKFADEFRLQAGLQRVPFSRAALTGTYVQLFPYSPTITARYSSALSNDINILSPAFPTNVGTAVSPRDAGVVVWGNVADGMLKYYLGVTDGETIGSSTDSSLAYTIRLQFTPTMLGFKGETGYTLADTYLGKQNVLSIGFGYRTVGRSGNNVRTTKMWTVDVLYEQKFGDIVPNLQVGYINQSDVRVALSSSTTAYIKTSQLYVQGQLLYDQVVGFGKPALAVRFEQSNSKDVHNDINKDEPKVNRLGVWAHYYIKGQNAKVSLGVDSVSLNSEAKNYECKVTSSTYANCKNFTDITLQFQTQF